MNSGRLLLPASAANIARKLIMVLPGQTHPEQHHILKEETFVILYGDVQVTVDGTERDCKLGDAVIVEKGCKHSFKSRNGAVIEEISQLIIKKILIILTRLSLKESG